MGCSERINKTRTKEDDDMFYRLNSYFHALEDNNLVEYHRQRGRTIQKKLGEK